MSLLGRRLARLAGTRSPSTALRAASRELRLRRRDADLGRLLDSSAPFAVGPFLGEVGYELLYWRPLVLRLLREHHVDPARPLVLGRGGSGAWYEPRAERSVDALELLGAEELRAGMEARVARTGHRKQTDVDGLDRAMLERAGADSLPVLHPLTMFWRMRFLWEGLRPPEDALLLGDYELLPVSALDPELEQRLPERFVAVKLYFNECLPDRGDARERLSGVVRELARRTPVVLLEAGVSVDEHADWRVEEENVVHVADLLRPATNLSQQAAVVARADALVSTYGGFSYLGPFLDVPTVALAEAGEAYAAHERVLRAVLPAARFERSGLDAANVVESVGRAG